jgi:hypothetical protein
MKWLLRYKSLTLALVELIVSVVTNRLWALGFFHVVGGGLWTAIDLFVGFIV